VSKGQRSKSSRRVQVIPVSELTSEYIHKLLDTEIDRAKTPMLASVVDDWKEQPRDQ